ncbi:VOC family protein [Pseudonocardia parietis]
MSLLATSERLMTPSQIGDISHVAITVTDIDASRAWYTELLGRDPLMDEDTGRFQHVVYQLGATLLSLHGFAALHSEEPFDELRPGLDHIGFGCACQRRVRSDPLATVWD